MSALWMVEAPSTSRRGVEHFMRQFCPFPSTHKLPLQPLDLQMQSATLSRPISMSQLLDPICPSSHSHPLGIILIFAARLSVLLAVGKQPSQL